jgi:hypothetical protein
MSHYEVYYGLLGSEVGYIRTAIQTGTLYFIAVFVYLIRKLPSYSIFIIVSFFHYSYLLIMPFMIILLFYYQGKINAKMR